MIINGDGNINCKYIKLFTDTFTSELLSKWVNSLDWLEETSARKELFMSPGGGMSYTYGQGRGVRTYTSVEMDEFVAFVMKKVNKALGLTGPMNGCFLNLYEDDHKALGWHADDFREMDHTKAVAVVSFGEPREIWWRPNGATGITPPERRLVLDDGSLFIMPPGFQHTHQHRVPKGDRKMNPRVSLTFRAFKES